LGIVHFLPGVIPILQGKGTDENAEMYAGQGLFNQNPTAKIEN